MRLRDVPEDLNEISGQVLDSAIQVHRALGPGLLESSYEVCLAHELSRRGLSVRREVAVTVHYDTLEIPEAYFVDILVGDRVVVEVKAVDVLHPVSEAQMMTYMRWLRAPLGLLINFHAPRIVDGGFIRRAMRF